MRNFDIVSCDVLIIGGGGAVLRASIQARQSSSALTGALMALGMVAGRKRIEDVDAYQACMSLPMRYGRNFSSRWDTRCARRSTRFSSAVPITCTTMRTGRGSTPILELARKIRVSVDPELPDKDISSLRMSITMRNGQTLTHNLNALKGSPSKPLSFDECAAKFKSCLEYSQKSSLIENADIITDFLFDLEKKEDVSVIFEYV